MKIVSLSSPFDSQAKKKTLSTSVTIATAKFDGGPQMALYFIATAEKMSHSRLLCTSSYAKNKETISH